MSVFTRGTASRSRMRSVIGGLAIAGVSALVLAGCAAAAAKRPSPQSRRTHGGPRPSRSARSCRRPAASRSSARPKKQASSSPPTRSTKQPPASPSTSSSVTRVTPTTRPTRPRFPSSRARVSRPSSVLHPRVSPSSFIDCIVAEGIITFSPANTSPDFTTWDDNGLYWRTAPSDLLQGEVLGNLIAEDGNENLGIIYLNDAYGTGLSASSRRSSRLPVERSSRGSLQRR